MDVKNKIIQPQVVPALEYVMQVSRKENLFLMKVGEQGMITDPHYLGWATHRTDLAGLKSQYGQQRELIRRLELLIDGYNIEFEDFLVAKEPVPADLHITVPQIKVPWKTVRGALGVACVGVGVAALLSVGAALSALSLVALDPMVAGRLPDSAKSVIEICKWHDFS
jgi:hypothetical protein